MKFLALATALCVATGYWNAAQSQSGVVIDTVADHNLWLSAGVGPGIADGERRIGGALSLWLTDGSQVFALRRAGASRLLEAGDSYDTALLYGRRKRLPSITAVVAAGLGISQGVSPSGDRQANELALALAGELALNVRFVGVGAGAFASVSGRRRVAGLVLLLEVGFMG
jgi:hypothetical protein